jgi:hypothetical protein
MDFIIEAIGINILRPDPHNVQLIGFFKEREVSLAQDGFHP